MSDPNPNAAELLPCPFCKQSDFDLVGLKSHLEAGDCGVFNSTEVVARIFSRVIRCDASPNTSAPQPAPNHVQADAPEGHDEIHIELPSGGMARVTKEGAQDPKLIAALDAMMQAAAKQFTGQPSNPTGQADAEPEGVAAGHNPDQLTNAQVETHLGWRLLEESETLPNYDLIVPWLKEIEMWQGDEWDNSKWKGRSSIGTFRTRLSPAGLAKARGIPLNAVTKNTSCLSSSNPSGTSSTPSGTTHSSAPSQPLPSSAESSPASYSGSEPASAGPNCLCGGLPVIRCPVHGIQKPAPATVGEASLKREGVWLKVRSCIYDARNTGQPIQEIYEQAERDLDAALAAASEREVGLREQLEIQTSGLTIIRAILQAANARVAELEKQVFCFVTDAEFAEMPWKAKGTPCEQGIRTTWEHLAEHLSRQRDDLRQKLVEAERQREEQIADKHRILREYESDLASTRAQLATLQSLALEYQKGEADALTQLAAVTRELEEERTARGAAEKLQAASDQEIELLARDYGQASDVLDRAKEELAQARRERDEALNFIREMKPVSAVAMVDLRDQVASLQADNAALRKALHTLWNACMKADERGELDTSITGEILDEARKLTSGDGWAK